MFKYIFNLFGENIWYDGFIFTTKESYNMFLYFGLFAAVMLFSYLIGSVNSAVIFSKIMYGEDIRKKGSGNAGMTNMMRTYGKGPAILTLVCDMLKTMVAMAVGTSLLGITGAYIAGLFSVIGHVWPIYYNFKGGKGVATSAMIILYLNLWIFLIVLAFFILIVWATKYLSLASVIVILLFPLIMYKQSVSTGNPNDFRDLWIRLIITLIISGIVVFKHRTNISRIMNGTENKFSFKKTEKRSRSNDEEK